LNIPEEMKIYNGWTKYILRKSSEKYLPTEIIWRKEKLGFVTPEKMWIDELKNELVELLENQVIPDIINSETLITIVKSRIDDRINLGEIWKIILFIRWYNVFNLK
jgi:asparagine synthase (glutamine-hydrolysing)